MNEWFNNMILIKFYESLVIALSADIIRGFLIYDWTKWFKTLINIFSH